MEVDRQSSSFFGIMPQNQKELDSTVRTLSSNSLDEFELEALRPYTGKVKQKKEVSFGNLEIHEHPIELGGAGVPESGAPMTLSWNRLSYFEVPVLEWEVYKPKSRKQGDLLLNYRRRREV